MPPRATVRSRGGLSQDCRVATLLAMANISNVHFHNIRLTLSLFGSNLNV